MIEYLTKLECCVRTQTSRGQSAISGRTLRRMMNRKHKKMKKNEFKNNDSYQYVPTNFVIDYF